MLRGMLTPNIERISVTVQPLCRTKSSLSIKVYIHIHSHIQVQTPQHIDLLYLILILAKWAKAMKFKDLLGAVSDRHV